MATTNSGFLKQTLGGVVSLAAVTANAVTAVRNALSGTRVDYVLADLSVKPGYAKNGAIRLALTGTTPKTIDLTDLTANAQSYAGDTAFAKFALLVLFNDGAAAVTFASGASNGASVGLSGTLTVAPGDMKVLPWGTAVTVDGTHKTIDITPTSGGSFVLSVGGQ